MIALAASVSLLAVYRLLVLFVIAAVGFKARGRYRWPITAAVIFGMLSNVAFLLDDLLLSGVLGVPYIGLVGWVFIDYMRSDVSVIRDLLAAKEAAWSKERHDLINDNAALRARLGAASGQSPNI